MRLSFLAIYYTVFVIVWGAWVRHSRSGAGCGDHWPLCDGAVIPGFEQLTTVIEWTHRLSSGIYGIIILALVIYAWRSSATSPRAKRLAVATLLFTIVEALIGAVLVKRGLVVDNSSAERAVVITLHLCNTFLLLGSLTLFHHALRGKVLHFKMFSHLTALSLAWIGVACLGAIASLSNSLYPSESLVTGIIADFSSESPWLLRLRILHPLFATLTAVITYVYCTLRFSTNFDGQIVKLLITASILTGFLNILLHAPVALALIHLGLANFIWIFFIRLHTQQA